MIKRIFFIVILIPLAIVLILLSVVNRSTVSFALNPVYSDDPYFIIQAPFFVFLFSALAVGLFIGSCITWIKQGKYRQIAREQKNLVEKWKKEADYYKKIADEAREAAIKINGSTPQGEKTPKISKPSIC